MSTGLLLVQLGSPASLDVNDIETYLHQFLGDWHTTGKKSICWQLLLKHVILPKGKFTSQKKYQDMFAKNNFKEMPLVAYSSEFLAAVRKEYANYASIQLAYQYGCAPSIGDALQQFEKDGIDTVHVLPLYPQRAGVTTQAAIDNVLDCAKAIGFKGSIRVANGFYQCEAWAREVAKSISEKIEEDDTLLVSFHSFQTWRVEKAGDPYRKDCEQSIASITKSLKEIAGNRFSGNAQLVYQSKYKPGKLPSGKWLGPSLVETLQKLGQQKKPVVVVSPVFTADNLETIYEIDDEVSQVYYNAGGPRLKRISCLNSRESWITAFVNEILPALKFV
ncbi:MAG: ferrochelatase [Fibrobacter sp.]|nr:ferrochelatase [Fibrobacter sp.]